MRSARACRAAELTVGSLSPLGGVGCLDLMGTSVRSRKLTRTCCPCLRAPRARTLLAVGGLSSSSVGGSVDAGDRVPSSELVSYSVASLLELRVSRRCLDAGF